jgi:hypothetical protein
MSGFGKDIWHKEVLTLALRNKVSPRRWGMLVTVYADLTPANNNTWILVYNLASTNKADNNNWQTLADFIGSASTPPGGAPGTVQWNNAGAFAGFGSFNGTSRLSSMPAQYIQEIGVSKYENFIQVAGGNFAGALVTNLISSFPSIPNNSIITVILNVSTIQENSPGATGFSYQVQGVFRKNNAGTISRIGSSTVLWTNNDTSDAFSVQELLTTGADISISTTLGTIKIFAPLVYSGTVSIQSITPP